MQFVSDIRRLLLRGNAARGEFPLDEEESARLWGAILDGALDDMEVGAVVAAVAVAGESRAEVMGLYRAANERVLSWSPIQEARAIVIPAYGLVPGEALIVSLAATLLRRFDVPVIVHGVLDSPCGVSTVSVMRELGVPPCSSLAQADEHLASDRIAFLPVQLLSSTFAGLLALRGRLGIENCAHLVAQALDPTHGLATRLCFSVGGTRSERFDALATEVGGDFVALGWPAGREPSNLSIRPRIERIRDGAKELLFEADVQETRSTTLPPPEDAQGIARWIQRVATGDVPIPVPAVNLLAACLYAVGHAPDFSQAKAIAALNAGRLAA
jgi:anthranilate phosphoribosyltransferase